MEIYKILKTNKNILMFNNNYKKKNMKKKNKKKIIQFLEKRVILKIIFLKIVILALVAKFFLKMLINHIEVLKELVTLVLINSDFLIKM